MKNLLKSFLFILAVLFILDRAGGRLMWWVNQHSQDMSAPKLKYLADEVNEDMVLLGTSRCNFHYVSSILADSLTMSVYNGGIDASDCIFTHYFALNQVLRHHTPKVVCLELMVNDFKLTKNSFATISFFAPYIGRSEYADSVFREAGNYWKYKLCHLYRYNAKAVSNIGGLLVSRQQGAEGGYIPLPKPPFFPKKVGEAKTPTKVDALKLKYMQKFINRCKEKNIKLIFMVSPAYTVADDDLYDVLKNVAQANDVPFFDYHSRGLFIENPEYFKDSVHLWDRGAQLYTPVFAHDLKKYLIE
ncbi:MAG: hypothetical protein E7090_04370 [Bacteroidales bacterium]|nr:hypothetical protein [Bacteroidales bacterium]